MQILLAALREDDISDAQVEQLARLLRNDRHARRMYIHYMAMTANIRSRAASPALAGSLSPAETCRMTDDELFDEDAAAEMAGDVGVQPPSQLDRDPEISTQPVPAIPSLRIPRSHDFVGGWAFSYAVATVFVCLLLLGFWAYKLPSDRGSSIASNENSRGLTDPGASPHARPAPVFVGRITGIAGAKWSDDPDYIAPLGYRVALSRQYKLKSGLLEITYDSGAKVILEGPCSYEVDSTAGGYLALGKLVAKVGAGGDGRGTGEVVSGQLSVTSVKEEGVRRKEEGGRPNADSLATRHSPLATNPSPLSPLPSPLFAVRTPTAVVTDLGTEFGVDVDDSGDTTSHVFQGSIQVRVAEGLAAETVDDHSPTTVILRENDSIRVGSVRETHQDSVADALVRFTQPAAPPQFTRRISPRPKIIDLLDIVAGGYGMGSRRERGINPTTGMDDPWFPPKQRPGDRRYRPVEWHGLIDGVFVPDGGAGGVQTDSAGHVFDGFPLTDGKTSGSIWARAAENPFPDEIDNHGTRWIYAIGSGERFMPGRRGLLALCPNAGITFDLAAIRETNPGAGELRFRAVAGLADAHALAPTTESLADIWILADGRVKFERMRIRPQDGAFRIDVELKPDERFLSLVSTDGGNGYAADYVVFGDPVLVMTPIESVGK